MFNVQIIYRTFANVKHICIYIFPFLLLAALTGCVQRNRVEARLDALDSLVAEHPDSVIGADSFLGSGKFSPRTIIAGHPARSMREIMGWSYKL